MSIAAQPPAPLNHGSFQPWRNYAPARLWKHSSAVVRRRYFGPVWHALKIQRSRGLSEAEHAAGIGGFGERGRVRLFDEFTRIVLRREFCELEGAEEANDLFRGVNAMGIEFHPWSPDRDRKVELATWRKDAGELLCCLAGSRGVQWVPVSAQPDVLGHVQTGQRGNDAVAERQREDVTG